MLKMPSKAAHYRPSCSMFGRIVVAFGSIPVARRLVATAHMTPSGVESTRMVAMVLPLSVGGKV